MTHSLDINLLLSIILILLLITLVLTMDRIKITKKIKLQQISIYEFEQRTFQSQMNPHFIFNSLNTIKHYVYVNNKTKADFAIDCFSIFLRKYIDYSAQNYVKIADEVKLLETYMALEKLRANDLFDTEILVEDDLKNLSIPTQLIQPFIENSIKHGILKSSKKGTIKLQFQLINNCIHCTIADNGIGMKPNDIYTKKELSYESKGIDLIQNKIKSINQITGNEIQLSIVSSTEHIDHGTTVNIKIPLLK